MRWVVALVALVAALAVGRGAWRARMWNAELELAPPPLAAHVPVLDDPETPRLARRVVLVIVDGLGASEAKLPFLDELRTHGAALTARVPLPTISRPNYVTILTGVPPRESGVRTNRVNHDVVVDSLMARAHAAQLRVVTSSNLGRLSSLFADGAFDTTTRVDTVDELATIGDAPLTAILVGDVDRAGHAEGVGDAYRAAARRADAMLRALAARLDFARDALVVTADHGHVARGGHGGAEQETSVVPLVLAGAGVVPAHGDADLVDVAPTVAALLGVPAPGHARGKTITRALRLSPAEAARRLHADDVRIARLGPPATDPGPSLVRLAVALAGAVVAGVLARRLRVRGGDFVGLIAFVAMLVAMTIACAGHISPSYVPSLDRTTKLVALGVAIGVTVQVLVAQRSRERTLAIAVVGLALPLVVLAFVRAWFSSPHVEVPSPFWMVAIPAIEIAVAASALAALLGCAIDALRVRRGARSARRLQEGTAR